jgi:hypothetical protein
MTMPTVLFVCYGSGHVRMVLPVARALQEAGLAEVQVLGLTTAADVVRAAGLPLLQIKDFVQAGDAEALATGRQLVAGMQGVTDPEESAAYLGLCHSELQATVGAEEAARRYAHDGRQAFLPKLLLERVLRAVRPRLLVATNSPRAERAAVLAARSLNIPAVCMVDLFAFDEVRWIGESGYADRICVLNEQVRQFLVAAGRRPEEVVVTGNPAFDALQSADLRAKGQALRQAHNWQERHVLLWPSQVEPAFHPFDGRPGDTHLPSRLLQATLEWVLDQDDVVLCVRPRPGEAPPALPDDPRVVVTGQDWPLQSLLAATDAVVTLNSTVGLEGFLAGARVIQVLGSVFDDAMPLARFGLADAAVPLESVPQALQDWVRAPRRSTTSLPAAAPRVLAVLREFL